MPVWYFFKGQGGNHEEFLPEILGITLPKTNSKFAPENRPKPKRKLIFQPSIFRGKLLVSGRVSL